MVSDWHSFACPFKHACPRYDHEFCDDQAHEECPVYKACSAILNEAEHFMSDTDHFIGAVTHLVKALDGKVIKQAENSISYRLGDDWIIMFVARGWFNGNRKRFNIDVEPFKKLKVTECLDYMVVPPFAYVGMLSKFVDCDWRGDAEMYRVIDIMDWDEENYCIRAWGGKYFTANKFVHDELDRLLDALWMLPLEELVKEGKVFMLEKDGERAMVIEDEWFYLFVGLPAKFEEVKKGE